MLSLCAALFSLAAVVIVGVIVVVLVSLKQVTSPGKPPATRTWIGHTVHSTLPGSPPELRKQ